jgi:hypothetical protein
MARPIWRGHLRLALVSCPVALYNTRHDIVVGDFKSSQAANEFAGKMRARTDGTPPCSLTSFGPSQSLQIRLACQRQVFRQGM